MPISVNPIFPVIAAQGAAPDLVLQPGTVIDARVLKVLSENLVRIAIASLSIDVLSEIPLQAGQALQLAVSQTEGGIRLAVVGQGATGTSSDTDTVMLAPAAQAEVAANPSLGAAPLKNVLTPLERLTVSAAAQTAATQQESLAPLFANLGAVAGSNILPEKLQQAVMQVLAQQTSLDQNLSGSDVKNAFQKSGLLLEASLASGSALPATGVPDLKAALIVLRQALQSSLGTATPVASPTAPAAETASAQHAAPIFAPPLSPELDAPQILSPQLRVPVADNMPELGGAPRLATIVTTLNLLQETTQQQATGNASLVAATFRGERTDDITFHTNTPPPPFRGALPTAQPVAAASIPLDAPITITAHHLLADTDAAIARQTLLQVASLPDRVDMTGPRTDPATPRWNFEIPFVTPQGTAIAQFEISRDGGGQETEAAKRVWRARFSVDVEPAGPVHALVSLTGEKTSVRMWVERPATAAQLRAGAAQLSQALTRAELVPGDIVIRDGAPPQPAPARAGHFLDRAL